jgi:predicted O-methyltransferase YrrM
MEIHPILRKVLESKKITDLNGKVRDFDSGISEEEALALARIVVDTKAKISIETGLAYGSSAITMCSEANKMHRDNIHYAVDPNQLSEYGGAAIAMIKEAGLQNNLTHLNGASHEELPELIKKGVQIDCAFIDGWHTFDYTLIDFFLIDKMLKEGGLIAFHDMYGLAKQKVLRYILTHRDYEIAKEYRINDKSFLRTLKFFIWRLYKHPTLLFSWFHWTYQTRSNSGLIVLRKRKNYEPPFSFYKYF